MWTLSFDEQYELSYEGQIWDIKWSYQIGNATNLSESYSVLHLMSSINSTSVQETTVRFLGWEDPLEKG